VLEVEVDLVNELVAVEKAADSDFDALDFSLKLEPFIRWPHAFL